MLSSGSSDLGQSAGRIEPSTAKHMKSVSIRVYLWFQILPLPNQPPTQKLNPQSRTGPSPPRGATSPLLHRGIPIMRWSRTLSLLLALALHAATAHAGPPACAPDIVGPWTGKVLDNGQVKDLRTRFSVSSGELTGSYHVDDTDGGYDGTLTDFTPSGSCAGAFLWHDRNGTGVVRVDFRPDRDRFDGEWGEDAPLLGHIFTGRRFRPIPIS
jgi:hypothetical protein